MRDEGAPGHGPTRGTAEGTLGYRLVRALLRLLVRVFYGRIEVVGLEHVPTAGPLIVAANHHNSVVDAMLLVAFVPRHLRVLAKAPLFHHPVVGPFLRILGALPVHRRQEAGDDPSRNEALFAATTAALSGGGAILLFPEGRTQPEPELKELRSGAARMLLAAEAGGNERVALLPTGLVYDRPGVFRLGRALVVIGPPLRFSDAGSSQDQRQRARELTERLQEALREQIVEAGDRRTLELLFLAGDLGTDEKAPSPDLASRLLWLQQAVRAYRFLKEHSAGRVAAFRSALEEFAGDRDRAGLPRQTSSVAGEEELSPRTLLSLLASAPVALLGIALHGLPYRLAGVLVRYFPHSEEEEATDKIAAGLLLFPLLWILEGGVALKLGGPLALVLFLLVLAPSAYTAVTWVEGLKRLVEAARAALGGRRDRKVLGHLEERRRALVLELEALERLVPPELNAGKGGKR